MKRTKCIFSLCYLQWSPAQGEERVPSWGFERVIQCPGGWTRTARTQGDVPLHYGMASLVQDTSVSSWIYLAVIQNLLWIFCWAYWALLLPMAPQLLLILSARWFPKGPVCLHGAGVYPWRGSLARKTLWEYTQDQDSRRLRWQVGFSWRWNRAPSGDYNTKHSSCPMNILT